MGRTIIPKNKWNKELSENEGNVNKNQETNQQ